MEYIKRHIIDDVSRKAEDEIKEIFITGLRLKGFAFKTNTELNNFLKERCSCTDHVFRKERVFYIDDDPFLLYRYDTQSLRTDLLNDNETNKITADLGEYIYL